MNVPRDLTHDCRRALRLQCAGRAVVFAGSVVDNVSLVDIATTGEFRATWADVDITLSVEQKVGSAKGAIRTGRPIPYWDVRHDSAIH